MIKFSHRTLIIFSGALWLAVGLYLLPLGIRFLLESAQQGGSFLPFFAGFGMTLESTALLFIVMGLAIGYGKSKAVFSKVVDRGVNHIRSLPPQASLTEVYNKKYLILLGVMVFLGIAMRWFPLDVRGFVDVAVGSALINGSMLYFRQAQTAYL